MLTLIVVVFLISFSTEAWYICIIFCMCSLYRRAFWFGVESLLVLFCLGGGRRFVTETEGVRFVFWLLDIEVDCWLSNEKVFCGET